MRTKLGSRPLEARLGRPFLFTAALALFACEKRAPPIGVDSPAAQDTRVDKEPSLERAHLDSDERAAEVQESHAPAPDTLQPPRDGKPAPDSDVAALAGVSPDPGPGEPPPPPEPGATPVADSDAAAAAAPATPTTNEPAGPLWTGRDG